MSPVCPAPARWPSTSRPARSSRYDFVDYATYERRHGPGFVDPRQGVDDKLVGIFTKGAVKGLIWYNTSNWTGRRRPPRGTSSTNAGHRRPGRRRREVVVHRRRVRRGHPAGRAPTGSRTSSSARPAPTSTTSGSPASRSGPSPEIKAAFETFGDAVANAYGGAEYVNATNFGEGRRPDVPDPPGCLLHHQASFITDFFKNEAKRADGRVRLLPVPRHQPGLRGRRRRRGRPVRHVQRHAAGPVADPYLLTPEAQAIWVERGGALSANKNVDRPIRTTSRRRPPRLLANAKTFRFDASRPCRRR